MPTAELTLVEVPVSDALKLRVLMALSDMRESIGDSRELAERVLEHGVPKSGYGVLEEVTEGDLTYPVRGHFKAHGLPAEGDDAIAAVLAALQVLQYDYNHR